MTLTTLAVVFEMPNKFLRVFLMVGLGQLSRIYRRGIRERFNLEERSQNVCTELLAHHKTLEMFSADAASEEGQLTLASIQTHFREILKDDTRTPLTKTEIDHMIAYAYYPLLKTDEAPDSTESSVKQDVKAMFGKVTSYMDFTGWKGRRLDPLASLYGVSGGGRILDFWNLCQLFRGSRKLSCIESIFTPSTLHQLAHSDGDKDALSEICLGGRNDETVSPAIHVILPDDISCDGARVTTTVVQAEDVSKYDTAQSNECMLQMIRRLEARLESVEVSAKAGKEDTQKIAQAQEAGAGPRDIVSAGSKTDEKLVERGGEHMMLSSVAEERLASLLAKYERVLYGMEVQLKAQLDNMRHRLEPNNLETGSQASSRSDETFVERSSHRSVDQGNGETPAGRSSAAGCAPVSSSRKSRRLTARVGSELERNRSRSRT
eukprot:TRINITY_DN6752_c0_g1_i2.p1 TRINITY_DN6752_c0_g1~~TRINITY_DN6752_c0_g1_i2.p1  ORF type:complete len:434 (+),score=67.00 TRINITY_DN6752_c0_g1_i2:1094-2395(+)